MFQSPLANPSCSIYIDSKSLKTNGIRRKNPTNSTIEKGDVHGFSPKLSPFLAVKTHPVLVLSFATHLPIISSVKPSGFNASEGIGYCSAVSTWRFFRFIPGFLEENPMMKPGSPHLKNLQIANEFWLLFLWWMSVLGMGELLKIRYICLYGRRDAVDGRNPAAVLR